MLNEAQAMRYGGRVMLVFQLMLVLLCNCGIVGFSIIIGESLGDMLVAIYFRAQVAIPLLLFFSVVLLQAWVLGLLAGRAVFRNLQGYQKIAWWYMVISTAICAGALWGIPAIMGWRYAALTELLWYATCMGVVMQLLFWLMTCWRVQAACRE